MANALGIDMGSVLNQQDRNRQRILDDQKRKEQEALKLRTQQGLTAFSQGDRGQKQQAVNELLPVNPDVAFKLQGAIDSMSEQERAQAKLVTDYTARLAHTVLTLPENQFEQGYAQVYSRLSQVAPDLLATAPAVNAPMANKRAWVEMQRNQALTFDQLLKAPAKPLRGKDGFLYNRDGTRALPGVQAPAEPRQTRTIEQGDQTITQEFNPDTGRFETIATAPRSTNTAAADANFVIDNDRAILRHKLQSMSASEILSRTVKESADGFPNPNYDEQLTRQVKSALKKKRGDDPDFKFWHQQFAGAPDPNAPPPPTPITNTTGVSATTAIAPAVTIEQWQIDMLRANPHLAEHFDQKFGAGAAQRVLQGQ